MIAGFTRVSHRPGERGFTSHAWPPGRGFDLNCECGSEGLTGAASAPGVRVRPLQVREAVREVLVVGVFGLLHHLVIWTQTKQRHDGRTHMRTTLTPRASEQMFPTSSNLTVNETKLNEN